MTVEHLITVVIYLILLLWSSFQIFQRFFFFSLHRARTVPSEELTDKKEAYLPCFCCFFLFHHSQIEEDDEYLILSLHNYWHQSSPLTYFFNPCNTVSILLNIWGVLQFKSAPFFPLTHTHEHTVCPVASLPLFLLFMCVCGRMPTTPHHGAFTTPHLPLQSPPSSPRLPPPPPFVFSSVTAQNKAGCFDSIKHCFYSILTHTHTRRGRGRFSVVVLVFSGTVFYEDLQ